MPKTPAWARNKRLLHAMAGLCVLTLQSLPVRAQTVPDLVTRDRLRVCADPANMPFSDKAGEGFENKIAEIVADELKRPLHYYWMPEGPGFVRNTLGADLCDVIMGYASGADIVDHTNPYYASTYVLVTRKGGPLDGVDRLEDPRLKGHKLGFVAATPPTDHLLRLGLAANAKIYDLLVDHRYSSPSEDAIRDLESGVTDAVILWGPIGGYYAKKASPPLTATPLVETSRPTFAFRIAFGIRRDESDWKHELNAVIRKRQNDIDAILKSYGVPLLPVQSVAPEAHRQAGQAGEMQ
jgi:quinoprotein dehydrogenase-associated probable ABC transporter substrate-binding protein